MQADRDQVLQNQRKPQPLLRAQTEPTVLFKDRPPLRSSMALERVTDRSDFQMQASYFPVTAEVMIALNSKHPEIKLHSFTNYPTKKLPRRTVLQLFQPQKGSHTSPESPVKRQESLTFQGSSDHEDVTSPPNFKQVQMLPISAHHSFPPLKQMASSHLTLAAFASCARPWESSVALRCSLSHL